MTRTRARAIIADRPPVAKHEAVSLSSACQLCPCLHHDAMAMGDETQRYA